MGTLILGGAPWKFRRSPINAESHGPMLGQDNNAIFGGLLGLSPEEIAQLEVDRVIY